MVPGLFGQGRCHFVQAEVLDIPLLAFPWQVLVVVVRVPLWWRWWHGWWERRGLCPAWFELRRGPPQGGSPQGGIPPGDPLPGGQGPGIIVPVVSATPLVLPIFLGSPTACMTLGAPVFASALGVLAGLASVRGPVPPPSVVGPALLSVPF